MFFSVLHKKQKAFTLVELLIVITIIGILAVALVPRLTGGPARARDAQRKADLQAISSALEYYYSDNGTYPDAVSDDCVDALESELTGLTSFPRDPSGIGSMAYCTTGYSYIPLNSDADSAIEGYLLIALIEVNESRTQPGIYLGEYLNALDRNKSAEANLNDPDNEYVVQCKLTDRCDDPTYQYVYIIGR